jgi:hypothetical protein
MRYSKSWRQINLKKKRFPESPLPSTMKNRESILRRFRILTQRKVWGSNLK